MRWHTETVPKWRTNDSRWTFVDVSYWFNRLSFLRNGILGASFEDFEMCTTQGVKDVTLFTRRLTRAPGFPTDNCFVFRLSSASCCVPFKWNAFFAMSFNPIPSRFWTTFLSSFCHSGMRSANRIHDLWYPVLDYPRAFDFVGHARKTSKGLGTRLRMSEINFSGDIREELVLQLLVKASMSDRCTPQLSANFREAGNHFPD